MALSSIFNKVNQFGKKAEQERQSSPQIIQKTKAVRHPISGSGIHAAFCKTDAGAGNTLVCYLNEDITEPPQDPPPTEIIVNFNISPTSSNLSDCIPSLKDGDRIEVYKNGDDWWCMDRFQKLNTDQLEADATDGLQTTLPECP